MKVINCLLVLVLFGFFSSCGDKVMDADQVMEYAVNPKNGFVKSKKVDWLQMDAFLKPSAYLVAREIKQGNYEEAGSMQALYADFDRMNYFEIRLSVPEEPGSNIETFRTEDDFSREQRLHYLSFSMQDDLYLLQEGKKIPCELFHFERNFNLSAHRTFMCAFPKQTASKINDITLVLDAPYFQTGPIKIFFSANDLAHSPQIKL